MFFEVDFVETHCHNCDIHMDVEPILLIFDGRWGKARDGRRVEPLESWTGRHTQQQRVSLALMN